MQKEEIKALFEEKLNEIMLELGIRKKDQVDEGISYHTQPVEEKEGEEAKNEDIQSVI